MKVNHCTDFEELYTEEARKELLNPKLSLTKQYLKVMDLEMEERLPKVVRINLKFEQIKYKLYLDAKKNYLLNFKLAKL